MDRMSGGETLAQQMADKPLFALWTPYGVAVDSKADLLRRRQKSARGVHLQHRNQRDEDDQARNPGAFRLASPVWLSTTPTVSLFPTASMHRMMVFDQEA